MRPAAAHGQVRPGRLQQHLSRSLLVYAMTAIAAGLGAGYPIRGWTGAHSAEIGTLTTAAVFLVLYPMVANLRVEAMVRAGRKVRDLTLALVYNFIWAPPVGLVLARVFLPDPLLALGFLSAPTPSQP